MKIKVEIELDTIRDKEELDELIRLINSIRNKDDDDEYYD
jgi:hypothetical protein